MSRPGASPIAQTQAVTADIVTYLRTTVPTLLSQPRAFAIRFTIRIRHGNVETRTRRTWDEYLNPIHHVAADQSETQINRIESALMRDLPRHLNQEEDPKKRFNGEVCLTVTVKDKTVAFAMELERQRLFTWLRDGTSAT